MVKTLCVWPKFELLSPWMNHFWGSQYLNPAFFKISSKTIPGSPFAFNWSSIHFWIRAFTWTRLRCGGNFWFWFSSVSSTFSLHFITLYWFLKILRPLLTGYLRKMWYALQKKSPFSGKKSKQSPLAWNYLPLCDSIAPPVRRIGQCWEATRAP